MSERLKLSEDDILGEITVLEDGGPQRRPAFAAVNDTLASILESAKGLGEYGAETGEGLARGAAQGATFGFADEITGGLEALKDVALTDKTMDDLGGLYEQHRDESRADYEASEEASPVANLIGNIGGGFMVPGLGAGNVALKGIKAVKAAPSLGKALLTGGFEGGITGMASGALSAAGNSEGSGMDLLNDTLAGGLVGGGIGGIAGGAGVGVSRAFKKGKDLLSDTTDWATKEGKLSGHIKEGFRKGVDDENIIGTSAHKEMGEYNTSNIAHMNNMLEDEMEHLGVLQKDFIVDAQKNGVEFDMKTLFEKMTKESEELVNGARVTPEEAIRFKHELASLTQKPRLFDEDGLPIGPIEFKTLSPTEVYAMRSNLNERMYADKKGEVADFLTSKFVHNLSSEMKDKIKGLREVDSKIGALADARRITGKPVVYRSLSPEERSKFTTEMSALVDSMSDPTNQKAGDSAKSLFTELNKVNPKLAKDIGEGMEYANKNQSFLNQLSGDTTLGSDWLTQLAGSSKNLAIYTAHVAGRGVRVASEASKIPGRVISKKAGALYDWTPDRLKWIADKANKAVDSLGNVTPWGAGAEGQQLSRLLTEASTRNHIGRNALLFAIEQNPKYREWLNLMDEEEDVVDQE